MTRFILNRALQGLLVLFIVAAITFTLMHVVPGGPFSQEKTLPDAFSDTTLKVFS